MRFGLTPPMTQPRMVLAGQTLLVTRRTVSRHYLFRPDQELNHAFRYCVALAAHDTGIILHAIVLMSTHYHILLSDPKGVHPLFTRRLNRLFANFTKVHRGWAGEVFNAAGPSVVALHTPEAVLDKMAYTLANPVAAGAVRNAFDWPGVITRLEDIGGTSLRVKKPAKYFRQGGTLPDEVELSFHMPECLLQQGNDTPHQALREALDDHQKRAREKVHAEGRAFLTPRSVMATSPYQRATEYEEFGSCNPTFATKGSGSAGFFSAVTQLRAFRNAYREAFQKWRKGIRDVVFPEGTWLMRISHAACCA